MARKVRSGERMAKTMAVVMVRHFRDGKVASLFAYEAVFIAALRRHLCLAGWPWAVADQAARVVVSEALRKARAERPSWAEGQRGYCLTDATGQQCSWCGGPLLKAQREYCSAQCRRSRWWADSQGERAA